MADLITTNRNIGQPNAPDISGAAKAVGALGQIVDQGAQKVGDYVHANNVAQSNALLVGAKDTFEKSYIAYSNDPMQDEAKLLQLNAQFDAVSDAYIQQAPRGMGKGLATEMGKLKNDYFNKALDSTQKTLLKNSIADATLTVNKMMEDSARAVASGDAVMAKELNDRLNAQLQAMRHMGVPAKQLINAKNQADSLEIYSVGAEIMKRARTPEERMSVVYEAMNLPKTDANNKAASMLYTEASRLNKVFKQGADLGYIAERTAAEERFKNNSVPTKDANAFLNMNARALDLAAQQMPNKEVSPPQALLSGSDLGTSVNEDYGLPENWEATQQDIGLTIGNKILSGGNGEPSLMALGEVQAANNLTKATAFTNRISDAFYAGTGQQAFEAYTVFNKVYTDNPNAFDLDEKSFDMFTKFRQNVRGGSTDYDEVIKGVRDLVLNKAPLNHKRNKEAFSHMMSGPKGAELLNSWFKSATGIDAKKSGSNKALTDYEELVGQKYVDLDGDLTQALERANDLFGKSHGSDMFSNVVNGEKQVVLYPPTQVLGMGSTGVNNQLAQTIYADVLGGNKRVRLSGDYKKLENATEEDLMYNKRIVAGPSFDDFTFRVDPQEIEVKLNDDTWVKGEAFLKANEFTEQNSSGKPVWEVWIRDKMGRVHPVPSNNSPVNNTMLFFGKTKEEFVPGIYKQDVENEVVRQREITLQEQGKAIWPKSSPSRIRRRIAYSKRREFAEDPENIKKADKLVRERKKK